VRDVATRLGLIRLQGRAEAFDSRRTVLVVIPGVFAGPEALQALPDHLGVLADVCRLSLPGASAPLLADNGLAAVANAVSEALEVMFDGRRVVLCGVSIGGVVAMAAQASNVTRIVALDPPLVPARIWPAHAGLRAAQAKPGPFATALAALFGSDWEDPAQVPDHRWVLDGLTIPTDVMLAGDPLSPPRTLDRWPSLVDGPERQRLARHPRVRLHTAAGAGHNLVFQAQPAVRELLEEACRRGSAEHPYPPREVDEPLLEATPLSPGRIGFLGAGGEAFAAAYAARAPRNELVQLQADALEGDDPLDAIVCGEVPDPAAGARLAERIRPGGSLIVRGQVEAAGLRALPPVDSAGTGVARFRKAGVGQGDTALHVHVVACASLLMDIRTRLPAQGLAADSAISVTYDRPRVGLPAMPVETPKVAVLQRPPVLTLDRSLDGLAAAIAGGWILVLEFDDHPQAIADYYGRPLGDDEWNVFRAAHAVQTSTQPLREAFRAYNPEVTVFENAVFELLPFPEREPPRKVFYGGVGRGAHAVAVARSLAPAVRAFPDLSFVVIGDQAVYAALPTERKELMGYMAYEAYLAEMSRCSVSLSPIEARPILETKSDAKFLDAARAGVLTIASPTVYGRTIRHGVNGLLANGVDDWAPLLIRALQEPDWNRGMARRAWEEVRDTRMFANQVGQRRDWYLDLWSRRAELDEAAMARLPGLRERVARLRKASAGA
jgi:hypothetical protein